MNTNNFFLTEKDNSIIKDKEQESKREVIIENPNEDISILDDIQFKKFGDNQKFLYEQIKELQTLNNLLSKNTKNTSIKVIENNEIVKESNSVVRSYNTLKNHSSRNLFKELSKNGYNSRKSFEFKTDRFQDEKSEKAINVIYTKLPQGDVYIKENEKYLNDSSVNL